MNIEPLSELLELTQEKEKIFQIYLPDKTIHQLINYYFYEKEKNDMFLDDKIICVSKDNGEIEYKGIIKKIDDIYITLKFNYQIITIDMTNYYIFIYERIKKHNDKNYFSELLKIL